MEIGQGETGTREFARRSESYDLVVVGAGPAGFGAALTAARAGARVALVTERPVLGGNHSNEIRIGLSGASGSGHRAWGRYSQETGVIEDFMLGMIHRSQASGAWRWSNAEQLYMEMALAEPNLRLHLNTLVHRVTRQPRGQVEAVYGVQQRSEVEFEFQAPFFIDCTGDGTLGYLAGADYRLGREARAEFGEPAAPETPDRITMGSTLNFATTDRGRPVPFKASPGSFDFSGWKDEQFPYFGRCFCQRPDGSFGCWWWAEIGGLIDPVADDEEVCRQARAVVLGLWDYVKNSGRFENVANQELDWIAPLPGKRESRRLLGPTIVTELTYKRQDSFPDAVAHCGYMLDVHPPHGFRNPDWRSAHNYQPGPGEVPLSCLYSRNVPNLFFAGRNVSATHVAIGTLRVACTCAVMGQAAGAAAALCAGRGRNPADLSAGELTELQTRLLRLDQCLLGQTLNEPADLSRAAQVRASSVRSSNLEAGDEWQSLERCVGLVVPVEGESVENFELFARGPAGTELTADLFGCSRLENYRLATPLGAVKARWDQEGWVRFAARVKPGAGHKLFIVLRPTPGVALRAARTNLVGTMGLDYSPIHDPAQLKGHQPAANLGFETSYTRLPVIPCFRLGPAQDLYGAQRVNDGHIRPYGLPHLWSSGQMSADRPEWIEYDFGREVEVGAVELAFNSELNEDHMGKTRMYGELAKSYAVSAVAADGAEQVLASETENFRRFRRHEFPAVKTRRLRLTVKATWGLPHAEVYDFRVYA